MYADLDKGQLNAVRKMKNGCILCGGVGTGKSRTALAYFYLVNSGRWDILEGRTEMVPLLDTPMDLYVITTAKKRDSLDWEREAEYFMLYQTFGKVVVDSWNNISKYETVFGSFFIFDEQRVVGRGAWVDSFLKLAQKNEWILLSATPGDTWSDYIPVFIANGFYKNRTQFNREHVIYKPYLTYPVIERYVNEAKLMKLRDYILVDIEYDRQTDRHYLDVYVDYNKYEYKKLTKERWNPYTNQPIQNISELCSCWRRLVNSDISRRNAVVEITYDRPKVIIFYNFDYELDILLHLPYMSGTEIAQWNGHIHEPIPDSSRWVYLVNYMAGAEGWNCTETDTIIFYSQNYSHRILEQSCGRIDRRNTKFKDLYYYNVKSRAPIDVAISKALKEKKIFNEKRYLEKGHI